MILLNLDEKDIKRKYRRESTRKFFSKIGSFFKSIFRNNIQITKQLINNGYFWINSHVKKINTLLVASAGLISALFIIRCFMHDSMAELINVGYAFGSYVILVIIYKIYHYFFGVYHVNEVLCELTDKFIVDHWPHLLKTYGCTGAGKDTAAVKAARTLSRNFRIISVKEMEEIKTIAFMFNFTKIEENLGWHTSRYFSPSEEVRKNEFKNRFINNKGFLKKRYAKKIYYMDLLEDWNRLSENKMYESEYIYDTKINKTHYVELVFEYVMNYIRLYYEKNFIASNEPLIEDEEQDLMAKMFSFDMMRIKNGKNERMDQTNYKALNYFAWPREKMILLETECDTWYINKSKQVAADINESGMRDFKAYSRHMFDDFYWIQIGQDASRVEKSIRELDHKYFHPLGLLEIDGGLKRNIILGFIKNIIDKMIYKRDRRLSITNDKITGKKEYIQKYKILYAASSKEKYLKKCNKLLRLEEREPGQFHEKLLKRRGKILEKMERNKNDGYIKELVLFSNQPSMLSDVEPTALKTILSKDKMFFKQTYAVELVFHKTDSWGKYNTHYLKSIKEHHAQSSDITFEEIPTWNPDMMLDRSDVLHMGYKSSFDFYNFSKKEIIEAKYRQVD